MSPTWPDLEDIPPDLRSLLGHIDHPRTEVDPELPAPIAEAPSTLPSHAPLRGNPSASRLIGFRRLGRHGFRVSPSALPAVALHNLANQYKQLGKSPQAVAAACNAAHCFAALADRVKKPETFQEWAVDIEQEYRRTALTAGCEPGADLIEPITQVLGQLSSGQQVC